jgi:signal peptidase II
MPKGFGSASLTSCFFVALFILISDQISKFVVVGSLRLGESFEALPFFNIVRVENKGVTFGLLSGTLRPHVFVVISSIIVAFLCAWAKKEKSYRLPASLIVGGAIGNMIDRILREAVIDFLDFHLLAYHWPAFNIADSAIAICTAVLFFISYRKERI